jgi:CheY-like chemotaxis protein
MTGCAITDEPSGSRPQAAPLAAADAPPGLSTRAEIRGRVLYIDDEEVNRLLMQALLGFRPGVDLQMAEDGTTGLAAALGAPPDLVLLDMRLPDMTGLQVLQQLRADPSTAGVPCVAVSANAMPADIAEAMLGGFDAYVTKPIACGLLFAEVDRLLSPRAG